MNSNVHRQQVPVREVFDPTGRMVIKRFKYDMVYYDGYMTKEDARAAGLQFRKSGHRIFIFTPKRSHGARGYPYNLWVSRLPIKKMKVKVE